MNIYYRSNKPVLLRSIEPSQFTSWAFTENVRRLGLISSMGTVGDCFDNAPMESFWGSMQIELLNRQHWRTNLQLAVGIADYIENFYNVALRHSALNYLTPIEFEDLHLAHIHQAALS
jgi:putative transposase